MNTQTGSDGTVGKALEALEHVAQKGRPVRFSELLSESPFPKATLYRFLKTLVRQGMLTYDDERQTYSLGIRLVRLAHAAWRQSSLAPIARSFIDKLAETTGDTVHLAQMDNGQVLYVAKRNAASPVDMFSQAGKIGPAYCTGVGKAILAFLDEPELSLVIAKQSFYPFTGNTLIRAEALRAELADIRADGIAYDLEEHETGIICIAAPILSASGRALGALSITASTRRNSVEDLECRRPVLLKTAAQIAAVADDWQFPA